MTVTDSVENNPGLDEEARMVETEKKDMRLS